MNARHSRMLAVGLAAVAVLTGSGFLIAEALDTGFTYRGRLMDGGTPANGQHDFTFALYDAEAFGSIVAGPIECVDVVVANGEFAVPLDFGRDVSSRNPLWLEIAVRPSDGGAVCTTLLPRQRFGAASDAPGVVGEPEGDASNWGLTGNAGTTPGTNFLGTTDDTALEIHVNSARALRIEPNGTSPSLIGGYSDNDVFPNAYGATISGGGTSLNTNTVTDNFGTIGGGTGNLAGDGAGNTSDKAYATVGGGNGNEARGQWSTVGGGQNNSASEVRATVGGGISNHASATAATIAGGQTNSASGTRAFVGGGYDNEASGRYSTVCGGYNSAADANYSTVGGGYQNAALGEYVTIGGGYGNAPSGEASTVGGGYDNDPSGDYATVAGGRANDANGYYASMGGGRGNTASENYATIAGGRANKASGHYTTVGGGYVNQATGLYASVGGGSSNDTTGDYATTAGGGANLTSGYYATISGGRGNTANNSYTTIAGGRGNRANTHYATVSGGYVNEATGLYASVGGGQSNEATEDCATVAGGDDNLADANHATVGGGRANTAKGYYATVGGGRGNTASQNYATVGGGRGNTANGYYATVLGGRENRASGDYSLATGYGAKVDASHDGAMLFADGTALNFFSSAANEFAARCTGGARFVSAVNGSGTPTAGVTMAAGGGSWSTISDRNAKRDFEAVDKRELLDRLAKVPITTWRYRTQDASIRHIGPVAQDFHAAFDVGKDDKRIATVDADGVALGAIQGLHELVKEKDAQIAALRARLEKVEAALGALARAENGGVQ